MFPDYQNQYLGIGNYTITSVTLYNGMGIPISPIIEDVVESSEGGMVPSRPGMFPNR